MHARTVDRRDPLLSLYQYIPHPHLARRHLHGPVKVADQLPRNNAAARFNTWLAVKITTVVGSMWCAYVFTLLALVSLPAVFVEADFVPSSTFPSWLIKASLIALVAWVAQTFLQLVLLPIIIVGQNVQALASDKRAEQTYLDAEAVLAEAQQIQQHLAIQDAALGALAVKFGVTLQAESSPPPAATAPS